MNSLKFCDVNINHMRNIEDIGFLFSILNIYILGIIIPIEYIILFYVKSSLHRILYKVKSPY